MRYLTILLAAALAAGCDFDTTGLERASSYAGELVDESDPATVDCVDADVLIGYTGDCLAFNANGTLIEASSFPPVKWRAAPDSVGYVTIAGEIRAVGAGDLIVTAEGPNTSASDTVTVVQ